MSGSSSESGTSSLRAVSLFANCGAGDVGYAGAGFQFKVIAELVPARLEVARLNHPRAKGIEGDLRETLPEVIGAWRTKYGSDRPDLLAACPPCQGMSTARGQRGRDADVEAGSRDPRNLLVEVIAEAVDDLEPRAIVVENVSAFLSRQVRHPATSLPISAAAYLIERLADRYTVFSMVSDLADFGVPQSRRRSFLTFIRSDEPALEQLADRKVVPFPAPSHAGQHINVVEALNAADLTALDAATVDGATSDDPHHRVPVWDAERYAMVAAIPPNKGGSAWQNDTCPSCKLAEIEPSLARCPACGKLLLRPIVTDPDKEPRLIKGFPTSYARMRADRPATTVTTASSRVSSDKTIHPSENRVLSLRECEILQTFPESFRWGTALEDYGDIRVRDMVGEAVPPLFTRQHGRVLAALLRGKRPQLCMNASDHRVKRAAESLARKADPLHVGPDVGEPAKS